MKKKLIALSLCIGLLFTLCLPASAAETPKDTATITVTAPNGNEKTFFFDLNDCAIISTDSDGQTIPQSRIIFSRHTLAANGANYYYKNDGTSFYLYAGTKITFNVNLASSATVGLGYLRGTSEKTVVEFTGTKHTATFYIPANDAYAFALRNRTSSEVIITNGSVNY